jgi:hypothetical protein
MFNAIRELPRRFGRPNTASASSFIILAGALLFLDCETVNFLVGPTTNASCESRLLQVEQCRKKRPLPQRQYFASDVVDGLVLAGC